MSIKIFNVNFILSYSFLLVLALSIITNSYNYLYVLLFSIAHECGHLAMLYLLGGRAESITISYYGIGLKHNCSLPPSRQIALYLAGPLVNLIFVLFDVYVEINAVLFFVNIVPVYPLDGGRALKLLLNSFLSLHISDAIFRAVTIVFILLMAFACVRFNSLSLAVITVYIMFYCINNSYD